MIPHLCPDEVYAVLSLATVATHLVRTYVQYWTRGGARRRR